MPRMLVVDDETRICEILKTHFSAKGFTVICAYTGQEALESLMDEPVDVVLLDIRLPDMSGIDVLKRAKELCPDAKVIMVTAVDQEELQTDAKIYGACGYVTKPFDFSDATWDQLLT